MLSHTPGSPSPDVIPKVGSTGDERGHSRVGRERSGTVALVTGAARGPGRSHAVHLAEEGVDIIAVGLCGPVRGVQYPPSSPEDLAETVRLIERTDQRIIATQADTRDVAVAGGWTFASRALGTEDGAGGRAGLERSLRITLYYLEADPVEFARDLAGPARNLPPPPDPDAERVLLAGPMRSIEPGHWDWFAGAA